MSHAKARAAEYDRLAVAVGDEFIVGLVMRQVVDVAVNWWAHAMTMEWRSKVIVE